MEEIERHWSLVDLLKAHEALDVKFEQEEWSMRRAEEKARLKGGKD